MVVGLEVSDRGPSLRHANWDEVRRELGTVDWGAELVVDGSRGRLAAVQNHPVRHTESASATWK